MTRIHLKNKNSDKQNNPSFLMFWVYQLYTNKNIKQYFKGTTHRSFDSEILRICMQIHLCKDNDFNIVMLKCWKMLKCSTQIFVNKKQVIYLHKLSITNLNITI